MRRRIQRVIAALMLAMSSAASLLAAEAPAAPGIPEPLVLNGKTAGALLAGTVVPEYPPVAKLNYIQGKVFLQVLVSRAGAVRVAHVLRGDPLLAAAALKAVRQWHYRPFLTPTGPAEFLADVQVNFTLRPRTLKPLPPHPEKFLSRQVRVPEVVERPVGTPPAMPVGLRLLVNEEGRVVDAVQLSGQPSAYTEACRIVDRWRFQPARWGAIPIPWYLEVNVPGGGSLSSSIAFEAGRQ